MRASSRTSRDRSGRPPAQEAVRAGTAAQRRVNRTARPADTAHPDDGPQVTRRSGPRVRWLPRLRTVRPRTVRDRLACLLLVPFGSFLALWCLAAVSTAQDVAAVRQAQRINDQVRTPVYRTVHALQEERRAAVSYAAAPTQARRKELDVRARQTAEAAARLRLDGRHTVAEGSGLPRRPIRRLTAFVSRLDALPAHRLRATARDLSWPEIGAPYTATIESAFAADGALSAAGASGVAGDGVPSSGMRLLATLGRTGELLAQEDALLTAASLTGALDRDQQRTVTGAAMARRLLESTAIEDLPATARRSWHETTASGAHRQVRAMEDAVTAAAPGRRAAQAAPSARWQPSYEAVRRQLHSVEADAAAEVSHRLDPYAYGLPTLPGAAVALGLAAVLLTLTVSVRIGRGLVLEVVALRNEALDMARCEPEGAASRASSGSAAPSGAPGSAAPSDSPASAAEDEIRQVGVALDRVHRAALDAVAERTELARGIGGVLVSLARRSQALVHRQLSLLDSMERRSQDPGDLGDLFRLGHLTTRMRRHADSLIILSGRPSGRGLRGQVPLRDVVRAAVSEIEDYARVEVRRLPDGAVGGGAVADLTHLLAELIENAAQFSPPHTKVRVFGEQVGVGHVLEIEDRGLGMGAEALAEANRRIEQSETLDLYESDRLGLFVVSRLAARHGIRVVLRGSVYGGTTAVVLLPEDMVHEPAPGGAPERADMSIGRMDVTAGQGPPGPPGRPEAWHRAPRTSHVRALPGGPGGAGAALEPAVVPTVPEPPGRADAPVVPDAPVPPDAPGSPDPPDRGHPSEPRPAAAAQPPEGDAAEHLPRRVRQRSLAAQLREPPAIEAVEVEASPLEESGRSPEQARTHMSAYFRGWARGAAADPNDVPEGTTSEDTTGDVMDDARAPTEGER